MDVWEHEARIHISRFNIPTLPLHQIKAPFLADTLQDDQDLPILIRKSSSSDRQLLIGHEKISNYLRRQDLTDDSVVYFVTRLPEFHFALKLTIEHDRVVQQPVMRSKLTLPELSAIDHEIDDELMSIHIDPLVGLRGYQITSAVGDLNLPRNAWRPLTQIAYQLYECYKESDATHVTLDPLLIYHDGSVTAAAVSMDIDINAAFRQQTLISASTEPYYHIEGRTVHYSALDGEVGCLANGAGLAMTIMDMIVYLSDGSVHPANFLDICGSTETPQIEEALRLVLSHPGIRVLLTVVNGSVTRCDRFAEVLIDIYRTEGIALPTVIRFAGNHAEEGRQIIRDADIPYVFLNDSLDEAVQTSITLAQKGIHVHSN